MPASARTLALPALVAGLLAVPPAHAAGPDWEAVSRVGTIEIVSTDPDGDARETKVWLIVLDGRGYVRTGSTRWGDNVERTPEVVVRIGGVEHPVRAVRVTDAALVERLQLAFRERYGMSDALLAPFRGTPRIFRLDAR
jgi:hypothetical protein